jgi:hypothetical protein
MCIWSGQTILFICELLASGRWSERSTLLLGNSGYREIAKRLGREHADKGAESNPGYGWC